MAALDYPCAKISLEEDVPTLFPVAEAMLMPPIRRAQAATRASTTAVHLGSKRAVSQLSAGCQRDVSGLSAGCQRGYR